MQYNRPTFFHVFGNNQLLWFIDTIGFDIKVIIYHISGCGDDDCRKNQKTVIDNVKIYFQMMIISEQVKRNTCHCETNDDEVNNSNQSKKMNHGMIL